ncbi:MAG: hypothetical protein IT557_11955 [Alphaproteobacteria bacterium]|nr:hypothetical protein [Alphaproteobacteria bacterium]
MSDALAPLIRDLLGWLAAGPRPYAEVIDAWRTSCPRLTVWEDAIERGLIRHVRLPDRGRCLELTPEGRVLLDDAPAPPPPPLAAVDAPGTAPPRRRA